MERKRIAIFILRKIKLLMKGRRFINKTHLKFIILTGSTLLQIKGRRVDWILHYRKRFLE